MVTLRRRAKRIVRSYAAEDRESIAGPGSANANISGS
jgi:hypothetical protein